jgi:hypothetical protein
MTEPAPLEPVERERTYRAIGRFIFEFSQLEYTLRHHVGELADVQEEFFDILTSSFDFARLCKAMLALSAMKNEGAPDPTLKGLINDCQKINEDRVRVVHGLWVFGTGHGRAIHTARDSMKSKEYFEEAGNLDAQSDRIQKLRWEIDRAIHDIWFSSFR